jgi:hydroxymethylpyrimidine pyrophosphatase-like HAD family hydrolase
MKVIAFDIDETIINNNNIVDMCIPSIINILIDNFKKGNKIVLITARYDNVFVRKITKEQLRKCGIHKYLNLDKDIYYTGGTTKVPYLKELDVIEFYDDACYNIVDIHEAMEDNELPKNFKIFQILENNHEFIDVDVSNQSICYNCI